jgi:hypothetical protein
LAPQGAQTPLLLQTVFAETQVLPAQQSSFGWPQLTQTPAVVSQTVFVTVQVLPAQQSWAGAPQGSHTPERLLQTLPVAQVPPLQQSWPPSPHGWQMLLRSQASALFWQVLPGQHGSPAFLPQVRVLRQKPLSSQTRRPPLQVRPAQQG